MVRPSSPVSCLAFLLVLVAGAAAQTTHVVMQIGETFVPEQLLITVGDTVEWHHTGGFHTVTEGVAPPTTGDEAFDEPLTAPLPLVSITFDAAFLAAHPRPNNRYFYYCSPHFSNGMKAALKVDVPDPWADLGGGLAGLGGVPQLLGTGTLIGGSDATVELSGAAPNATAVLFLSTANAPAPFKCGTLSTVPVLLSLPLATSPTGEIVIPFLPWPPGLPSGVPLYWQYAILDGAAVCGVSISNLLESTLP